jgi:UDP:flavonoid glycosyltransferase YjiC (YdhE family)
MPGNFNKTILVTSLGASMAHVVRPLEVAKILRQMGYRIVFSGSGKALKLAQQSGFELRYLPDWDLAAMIVKLKAGSDDIHTVEQVDEWVRAELTLYQELKPLIVLDDARITSNISTAVAGLPRISIQNAYITPWAINGFVNSILGGPRSIMEPGDERSYNQIRRQYGLPPVKSLDRMLEADLNLLCDIPEYVPMHTVPDHYHYVGPLIWGSDLAEPPWWDELDPDRPTLYFTMGSTGSPEAFQAAIEFLGGTEYQVMMTLGSLVKEDDLKPLPPGFFVASYASGDSLAGRADVIICHAGNGTAYQGLRSGVPIISWPTVKDQRWNARRLSELGVSVTISSPTELLDAVGEVLANPGFRVAAGQFSKILAQYNGPETAARLIHEYMENSENH